MSEFEPDGFDGFPSFRAEGGDGWLSEDDVKGHVKAWLESADWQVDVAWGRSRGIDVFAVKGEDRWAIEVKGGGSLQPMRVNYFLMILGEILQRMEDPSAQYSIALPDMRQFRGLWARLPRLAKSRMGVSALFVSPNGDIDQLSE